MHCAVNFVDPAWHVKEMDRRKDWTRLGVPPLPCRCAAQSWKFGPVDCCMRVVPHMHSLSPAPPTTHLPQVNPEMESFDVAVVIGANDTINSAAIEVRGRGAFQRHAVLGDRSFCGPMGEV